MTLPVYEHHLTVGEAAVTPRGPLFCGTAGDKHAAKLIFSPLEAGYHYRLEIVNGAGEYDITERLTVANGEASVTVPAAWTAAGTAAVRLLQFEEQDGTESARCYYPPVLLSFAYRDEGGAPAVAEPLWQEQVTRAEALLDELTVTAADAQRAIEAAEQSMNAAKQAVSAATLAAELAAEAIEKADAPKPAAAVTVERGDENFIPLGDNVQTALGNLSTALLRYDNEVHERMDDMGDTLADVELGVHDLEIKHARYERDARQLFAGALKGTAEGAAVTLHDVSPVPHEVAVTVSDPAAKVVTYGKNLYKHQDYAFINGYEGGYRAVKTERGFSVTGRSSGGCYFLVQLGSIAELGGKRLTLSYDYTGNPYYNDLEVCGVDYKNQKSVYSNSGATLRRATFDIPQASEFPDGYIVCIRFNGDAKQDPAAVVTFDNIQVEFGDTATAYEPYKERKEYAQGEAVLSVSPSMSITTDTAGALVSVEYNRDLNAAFDALAAAVAALQA